MLLYIPLVLVAAAYLVYWYVTRTFNYWKKLNIPGPEPVPLFGNLKKVALRQEFIGTTLHKIHQDYPNEKVVGIYRMTTPSLLIRDLDIIKSIWIKDFDSFADRGIEFSKQGLGQNLFHADGDTWRVLRTQFTPIFTTRKLKNMFPLIYNRAEGFINHFDKTNPDLRDEQDIITIAKSFTLSSITTCAFGLDLGVDNQEMDILRKIDNQVLTPNIFMELDMMYPGLLKKINLSLFPKDILGFFRSLVKTVSQQRGGKPTDRNDFMDFILEMKQQKVLYQNKNLDESKLSLELTDDIIAAQAFVFYVAGFETSSSTAAFALYELAQNPDVQEKLIEEIDEALNSNDGNFTYDVMSKITYLNKVVDETLRMHTVVDPLQRSANVDYKIPGTDIIIKKGQTVLLSASGLHYDEELYPDPNVFDPERFSPENSGSRHSCAYIPFGAGPRNCIGMRFGLLQSRLFLALFLSKFRVAATESLKRLIKQADPNRIVLGTPAGITLKVTRRVK